MIPRLLLAALGALWLVAPASAAVRITEFMASNATSLADEDGEASDWIELHNDGSTAVDLAGYYLTDSNSYSPGTPGTFWRFPAYSLSAGGYLVVFASGKDRAPAAPGELHTSFRLSADGERLSLFEPDGTTFVDGYPPVFPPQRTDVSYGRGQVTDPDSNYIRSGSPTRVFIPTSAAPPAAWTGGGAPFDDSAWLERSLATGFDSTTAGFTLIENFDPLDIGPISGQGGWSASSSNPAVAADPAAGENQVLRVSADGVGAHIPISIPNGTTSTLYFRMRRDGIVNISAGASDSTAPSNFPDYEAQVNNQNDALLKVRNGGAFNDVGAFNDSTWYHLWMVINNSSDTYEVYAQGGALAAQTKLQASGGQSVFGFRNGVAANTLARFYVRTGAGTSGTYSVDDIYLANGTNLATPTGGSNVGPLLHANGNIGAEMEAAGATTAYLRSPFTPPADQPAPEMLILRVRYDDGFVAFLNGTEIARRNVPAGTPPHDATSTSERDPADSVAPESIDVSASASLLVPGQQNILAIHALNSSAADPDLLMAPELIGIGTAVPEELYFPDPTPGMPNGLGFVGFVRDTAFSVDRGFYSAPFDTTITSRTPGATIIYTTDGSEPTLQNGTAVQAPNPSTTPSAVIPISTTTTLRAAAFLARFLPTNTDTQTYLFTGHVVAQPNAHPGYPTVLKGDNGSTTNTFPADYEMDPEITNDPAYSALVEPSLRAIPSISIVTAIPNLFDPNLGIYQNPQQSGSAWERPASVELLHPDGTPGFQVDAGIRIQGGHTRIPSRNPKHSFRVSFRRDYGPPSLEYPLFSEPTATTKFDEFILRAFGNQSWLHHNNFMGDNRGRAQYIRDQWAKDTQLAMGWPACHNNLAHLYLNGIYWGVYNPTERPTAGFGESYLGGDKVDYDSLNSGELKDGTIAAFNDLFARANADLSVPANYDALAEVLDLPAFADYILLNQFGGNKDWDDHNWYSIRNRNGGKWFYVAWDNEFIFIEPNDNILGTGTDSASYRHPTRIWKQLMRTARFRLLYADRIHRHLFNDGLLTTGPVKDRYLQRRDAVYDVLVTESARWGDYRRDVHPVGAPTPIPLYDRDQEWQLEFDRIFGTPTTNGLLDTRTATVLAQYTAAGFYPTTPAPEFASAANGTPQHGGAVPTGFQLALTTFTGDAFYTTDGSDPNDGGGTLYSGPITLNESVTIRARAVDDSVVSALTEAEFFVGNLASATSIVVSEICYHPADPTATEDPGGIYEDDDFEFLELLNVSPDPVDLAGFSATDGITFTVGTGGGAVVLAPGERALVVRNADAFGARYPSVPASRIVASYDNKLNNGGETLTLTPAVPGAPALTFSYNDDPPWPNTDDGFSIVLRNPAPGIDHGDPASWRRSASPGGAPNTSDAASFPAWQLAHPGATGGPAGNPDHDTLTNLMEYVLRTSPTAPDPPDHLPAGALEPITVGGVPGHYLTLTFRQDPAADDVLLEVESSAGLGDWRPADAVLHAATNLPDGTVLSTYRLPAPLSPDLPEQFLRLRATLLAP